MKYIFFGLAFFISGLLSALEEFYRWKFLDVPFASIAFYIALLSCLIFDRYKITLKILMQLAFASICSYLIAFLTASLLMKILDIPYCNFYFSQCNFIPMFLAGICGLASMAFLSHGLCSIRPWNFLLGGISGISAFTQPGSFPSFFLVFVPWQMLSGFLLISALQGEVIKNKNDV